MLLNPLRPLCDHELKAVTWQPDNHVAQHLFGTNGQPVVASPTHLIRSTFACCVAHPLTPHPMLECKQLCKLERIVPAVALVSVLAMLGV